MTSPIPLTPIVAALPTVVPFVAPEALERQSGQPFVLRLGANESAFGPSPLALQAMQSALTNIAWYGDPESYELRTALAQRHGIPLEQIVIGSGIDDLLGLIVRAYLEPGAVAVTSQGAYPTFNYHVAGYGGVLQQVPYRDDANDLQALAEAARHARARLLYLANPDNPSGSWHTADALQELLAGLPADCLLVLDEAYAEFAPADVLLPLEYIDPRVIRLGTFSKAFGMAGARIGYATAPRATIQAFDKIRLHFGGSRVAQAGAIAALADTDYLQTVVTAVALGRAEYATLAQELGLVALPSATNFITIDVGGEQRARQLVAALAREQVFIRMPGVAPLNRCIRVTVGTPEERTLFATILRRLWPTIVHQA